MAAKRLAPDFEKDAQPNEKRLRTMPSFASVIGEVMKARSFQSFLNSFEPMLRRVVNEEVERGIQRTMRTMTRSPSLRIQAPEPSLKLMFVNNPSPVIFTCNKISDIDGEPLQLRLVEKIGDQIRGKTLPHPVKVEIVVIDGDFPTTDRDVWTVDEFNRSIKKERAGRRPLITKEVNYTIRDECFVTLGDLEFTDNSSWTRSRKFKLGARVIAGCSNGTRILEALTDAFIVKDQRGEVYKKHYPPMLKDEVWRLEKIGKDGKFHKRLERAGIKTVQDFLKLSVVDSTKLKKILGEKTEMSDRLWESILKHAKTCDVGNKLYICHGSNYTVILDATCNIFRVTNSAPDLIPCLENETIIRELVKNAYENWDSLQEVDREVVNNESLQQFQGNNVAECSNQEQCIMPYGGFLEVEGGDMINNNIPVEFQNWDASSQLFF